MPAGVLHPHSQQILALFADLQYDLAPNWNLGFAAGGVSGKYQQPPSAINNSKDVFANSPKYDAVEDIQGAYGQAALSYQGSGPLSMHSWVFINHLKEDPKRYDNANYNSMNDSSMKTYDLEQKTDVYGSTSGPPTTSSAGAA